MKVLGSVYYVHVPKSLCGKLDSKSKLGLFRGYFYESKAYRIWDVMQWRIIVSRDVMVDEHMNQSISLINSTTQSNIIAFDDMTTPSTIGQLEYLE
jgi:hypothetical protein